MKDEDLGTGGDEMLTTQDEDVIKSEEALTKDEEINDVGSDVETIKPPKTSKKKKDDKVVEEPEVNLKAAVTYLAKFLLTPSDLEDFKKLYPKLF